MKTLFFTIIIILFASLVIPTLQNAIAIPYVAPQDLYKQSDMVFYGQVITKQAGPGPDYDYYQVQVKTYFKNPQTSDSITVAGHKPDNNTRMAYPQFKIGDKAIFYINKLGGINTMSPYSQIAGEACDVRSFVEPYILPSSPTLGAVAQSTIYIEDVNENMPYIPLVNHTAILRDENVWNNSPESRTVPVTLTIQNEDTGQQVFNQTQNLEMQACSGPETVKWNFVPTQIANYVASVSGNKNEISMIFQAIYDSTKSPILSPLKQFKSGVSPLNVKCSTNYALVIKTEDGSPACVQRNDTDNLMNNGWAINQFIVSEVYRNQGISIIQRDSGLLKYENGTFMLHMSIYVFINNFTQSSHPLKIQVLHDDAPYQTDVISSTDILPDGFYKYQSTLNHEIFGSYKVIATYENRTSQTSFVTMIPP
jgi:hypothetical protein